MSYKIVSRPGGGLMILEHPEYGRQFWSLVKMRKRETSPCALCGSRVGAMAYRPATNKNNRMERICTRHEVSE